MIDTKKKLKEFAKDVGFDIKISDDAVTFFNEGMDSEDFNDFYYKSSKVTYNSYFNNVITHFISIMFPEYDEEQSSNKYDIETLVDSYRDAVQVNICFPKYGMLQYNDRFVQDKGLVQFNSLWDTAGRFNLSFYELFSHLGMSENDMKERFNVHYDANNNYLDTVDINSEAVLEAVEELTVADLVYVYLKLLLNTDI